MNIHRAFAISAIAITLGFSTYAQSIPIKQVCSDFSIEKVSNWAKNNPNYFAAQNAETQQRVLSEYYKLCLCTPYPALAWWNNRVLGKP